MKRREEKQPPQLNDEAYACTIMITCRTPDSSGNMDIEMSYEGDPALAAMMLQGAQGHFDELIEVESQMPLGLVK